MESVLQSVNSAASDLAASMSVLLPRVAAAVVVVLLGWLAAVLLRRATARLVAEIDRVAGRLGRRHRAAGAGGLLLPRLVYWLVLLTGLAVAFDVLGSAAFGTWVDAFFAYLPALLAALAVIVAGWVLGAVAEDLVAHAAQAAQFRHHDALGALTRWSLVVVALLVGATQAGIDVSLLSDVVIVLVASAAGALALAFALATPPQLRNFIGARYLRSRYRVGDRIAVDDSEGTIVEFTPYAVVVDTAGGELHVPGHRFVAEAVHRLKTGDADAQ